MKAKESTAHPLHDFYADIHGTYDRINRIFTFGCDQRWRRKAAGACLEDDPGEVLDICSGTGDFVLEMLVQSPGDRQFTAYDFSEAMLSEARKKWSKLESGRLRGRKGPSFVEGAVGAMPFEDEHFDAAGITFGLRNLIYENPDSEKHLAEILRVLRSGGRLVILESSKPSSVLWRFFNGFYLRFVLPCIGGLISGNFKAYRYLARSSENYYSLGEMAAIMEAAGFYVVEQHSFFLGSVMLLVVKKKPVI